MFNRKISSKCVIFVLLDKVDLEGGPIYKACFKFFVPNLSFGYIFAIHHFLEYSPRNTSFMPAKKYLLCADSILMALEKI